MSSNDLQNRAEEGFKSREVKENKRGEISRNVANGKKKNSERVQKNMVKEGNLEESAKCQRECIYNPLGRFWVDFWFQIFKSNFKKSEFNYGGERNKPSESIFPRFIGYSLGFMVQGIVGQI